MANAKRALLGCVFQILFSFSLFFFLKISDAAFCTFPVSSFQLSRCFLKVTVNSSN